MLFRSDASLDKLVRAGRISPEYFPLSGPDACEEEAVKKLVNLAAASGGRAYVCHLTSEKGLKAALSGKRKAYIRIESCPHYLFLNDGIFKKKNGFLFCCNPVLKKKKDNRALFSALNKKINWIGTDHCAFSYKAKSKNKNNFLKIPRGLPGIGMSFPLLFTRFANTDEELKRISALTSANPAKFFGMADKGKIEKGKDARSEEHTSELQSH